MVNENDMVVTMGSVMAVSDLYDSGEELEVVVEPVLVAVLLDGLLLLPALNG